MRSPSTTGIKGREKVGNLVRSVSTDVLTRASTRSCSECASKPSPSTTDAYANSETGAGSGLPIKEVPDMLINRLNRGSFECRSKLPETWSLGQLINL